VISKIYKLARAVTALEGFRFDDLRAASPRRRARVV
jgi:hypothetical protein